MSEKDSKSIRWPPERFYWSVLDAPGREGGRSSAAAGLRGRAGPAPIWARQAFEEDAPEDPGQLHAVSTPIGDGRVVVCAATREALAALGPSVLVLSPERYPPFLDHRADAAALNLLVGEFEPVPIRRARARSHATHALTTLACCLLIAAGFARRASHSEAMAQEARREADGLAAAAGNAGGGAALAPESLLSALAAARLAAGASAHVNEPGDAAAALALLLRAWPADVPCKPHSITVAGDGAAVSVAVEGDPAPFLRAFTPPVGWTLEEPRVNTGGAVGGAKGMTRLALTLRRAPGAKP